MDRWEHMFVAVEKSGSTQTVAYTATGARETAQGDSPTALLTVLDLVGREGWQLVGVDSGMHWLRRPIAEGKSRNW